jgi:N-dimethylarginine dimethylaminohydrolase
VKPPSNGSTIEFALCCLGYGIEGLVVNGGADFFLVIGPNVILLNNLRYPFRRKQIYTVRPILEPLLKNSRAKYVAMPPASPHYDPSDPFLERGDIMLDGCNVYVGISGNASNTEGVEWLKRYLGSEYNVYVIKPAENILHLDTVLTLNKSGLLTYYPEFMNELPAPFRIGIKSKYIKRKEKCWISAQTTSQSTKKQSSSLNRMTGSSLNTRKEA